MGDRDLLDVPALAGLRREIDAIDAELVALLRRRLDVVERVLVVKRGDGLRANIPARVEQVVGTVRERAQEAGLPPELAETLWRPLIGWTIAYEEARLARN